MKQEITSNFTILNSLFQKLQHEETGQYFCSYQEVMAWPKWLLAPLIKAKFLVKANQAKWLICPECYRECYKEVEREKNGSLFIYCHEPDEINSYIPIQKESLQQWAISQKNIANFIASFFDPNHEDKPALWADVGMSVFIKGKPAHIKLVWERQLCFQVNKETPHPLTSLLVWHKEGFGLNMEAIEVIGETAISKHTSFRSKEPNTKLEKWMANLPEEPRIRNDDLIEKAQEHWPGISGSKVLKVKAMFAPKSWQGGGAPPKPNRRTKKPR